MYLSMCGGMTLSKKLHLALLLAVVFSASFFTVFLAIFISQSAYSSARVK
jgi:hypothetical protein